MIVHEPGATGRAYLGFDEPPVGSDLSATVCLRMYRLLRRLEIGCFGAGVAGPIAVWLITRDGSDTGAAVFTACLSVIFLFWTCESQRRDLRRVIELAAPSNET